MAAAIHTSLVPGSAFPRLFVIETTPLATTTTDDLETAIYREIDKLAREGPTEEELARVRNQTRAGVVRRLQSNFGLALQLTEYEAVFGGWEVMLKYHESLRAVTANEARQAAVRYLTKERRTVAKIVGTRDG